MNATFQTTERTGKFVLALSKIQEAETAVLEAMTETYGEKQGTRMTETLPFEDINDEVLKCMRIVILENLNENPLTI